MFKYDMFKGHNVIGIQGPANSGKDTFADMYSSQFSVIKRSMSTQLYIEISDCFDVDISILKDRSTKEMDIAELDIDKCKDPLFKKLLKEIFPNRKLFSSRVILELYGTEYRRNQDTAYWCKFVFKNDNKRIIVPDIRFIDERQKCDTAIVLRCPGQEIIRDHSSDLLWRDSEDPVIWNFYRFNHIGNRFYIQGT